MCTRSDRSPRVAVIVCAWEEDEFDRRARLPTADADLHAGCIELGSAEYHDLVEHSSRLGSSLELLVSGLSGVLQMGKQMGWPFTVCRVYEINCAVGGNKGQNKNKGRQKKNTDCSNALLAPSAAVQLVANLVDFEPLGAVDLV